MATSNGSASTPSNVEATALRASNRELQYPDENLPIIEVENFPTLGKVVAARFIEWVQNNPGGVISLPTGRTPEHFIRWVRHFLDTWGSDETRKDLEALGLQDTKARPDMFSLHFLQMDEFFPINPAHTNSFSSYVKEHYAENFGLDPAKVRVMDNWLLGCGTSPYWANNGELFADGVDLTVTERAPATMLERAQATALTAVHQYCNEYEEEIRGLGGIGFFLGGIGPDGHVAFNCKGKDHNSTTRLTKLNYQSAAAAASDLGGIETARKKHVITIGLGTVKYNPQACIVVFAAGGAKAQIIANAVEGPKQVDLPATTFYGVPGFRFYLTQSACTKVPRRRLEMFKVAWDWVREKPGTREDPGRDVEMEALRAEAIIDLALQLNKKLSDLTEEDFDLEERCAYMLKTTDAWSGSTGAIVSLVEGRLIERLEDSLSRIEKKRFIHTAPHHDDIMLGYLPIANELRKEASNEHTFVYATSGFNAVTNALYVSFLEKASLYLRRPEAVELVRSGHFQSKTTGDPDVNNFMNAHASRDAQGKDDAISQRILRCLATNFLKSDEERSNPSSLQTTLETAMDYYRGQYQGQKDAKEYQVLKGMLREFECDALWGYHGFVPSESVAHLRMGFYKGDLFTEDPKMDRDVQPLAKLMKQKKPDYVTVALDPEGSGPDTHYKVLQAVSAACSVYCEREPEKLKIWGYRNVWYRFHPSEAELMYPVSLGDSAHLNDAFETCFISQKEASFPAPDYDGPFSHWAQMIQAEQYQNLVKLLGEDYFTHHKDPRMRAARGFVFLKELDMTNFLERCRQLKGKAEGV